MSTRKYNAISSFEMKGSNRDHSGQSIDEYQNTYPLEIGQY